MCIDLVMLLSQLERSIPTVYKYMTDSTAVIIATVLLSIAGVISLLYRPRRKNVS